MGDQACGSTKRKPRRMEEFTEDGGVMGDQACGSTKRKPRRMEELWVIRHVDPPSGSYGGWRSYG